MKASLKLNRALLALFVFGISISIRAQGTFIYDQQSGDESIANGASVAIQAFPPLGQSFTPTNASVGFVRFNLADNQPGNGIGATVVVNLRSNSISGPVLGVATPVFMPDNFGTGGSSGFTNFLFSSPVAVTPGLTYVFDVAVQSGDPWSVDVYHYSYPGGTVYESGIPAGGSTDMWFREGVVPEPSSFALLAVGVSVLALTRRMNKRESNENKSDT
jgi:hypothetical protein